MSEVLYGGNGIKERTEYLTMRGETLTENALMISKSLDAFFEQSSAHAATYKANADTDSYEREMSVNYAVFDKTIDDAVYFDINEQALVTVNGLSTSYEKSALVRHTSYTSGPKREEYYLLIELQFPYVNGTFFQTFLIEFFTGDSAHVTVTGNNIDVDDSLSGVHFERPMCQYDLQQFHKEMTELNAYLASSRAEVDIDQGLANRLQ